MSEICLAERKRHLRNHSYARTNKTCRGKTSEVLMKIRVVHRKVDLVTLTWKSYSIDCLARAQKFLKSWEDSFKKFSVNFRVGPIQKHRILWTLQEVICFLEEKVFFPGIDSRGLMGFQRGLRGDCEGIARGLPGIKRGLVGINVFVSTPRWSP